MIAGVDIVVQKRRGFSVGARNKYRLMDTRQATKARSGTGRGLPHASTKRLGHACWQNTARTGVIIPNRRRNGDTDMLRDFFSIYRYRHTWRIVSHLCAHDICLEPCRDKPVDVLLHGDENLPSHVSTLLGPWLWFMQSCPRRTNV